MTTLTGQCVRIPFRRPHDSEAWVPEAGSFDGMAVEGGRGWQGNGGPGRKHPARGLPFSLEVPLPPIGNKLRRIHFFGVFALYGDAAHEPVGSIGANLLLLNNESVVQRLNLVCGTHYGDPSPSMDVCRQNGDGTSIETVSRAMVQGEPCRVDRLSVDVAVGVPVHKVIFRDMGTAASFIIYDILAETDAEKSCPFRGQGEAVALGEIGTILRLRDRSRFEKALRQVEDSIKGTGELDEARGLGLAFLAVVHSSMLELGSNRRLHRFLLDSARALDQAQNRDRVFQLVDSLVQELVAPILPAPNVSGDLTMDKAVDYVERNFAGDISESDVAQLVGLSASHFRFLFRQRTGAPFHKYIIARRLERAREIILAGGQPLGEVAKAVGFTNAAHFSRAFAARFGHSPSALRMN